MPASSGGGRVGTASRAGRFRRGHHAGLPTLWRDTFTALAFAATATERVELWSSVTNVVTRQPIGLASSVRTVAELCGDRFRLGIGAADSSAFLTGRCPATTGELRSGIALVTDLLRGAEGKIGDHAVTLQDPSGPVPVYLAAEGPRNTALAVEVADGVMTTFRDVDRKAERIAAAYAKSGRTSPFRHIVVSFVKITDDPAREARELKPRIVKTVQAEGARLFEEAGFDIRVPSKPILLPDGTDIGHPRDMDEAIRVASQWVPDEAAVWYAGQIGLFGTPREIVAGIERLAGLGVAALHMTDGGSFDLPDALIEQFGAEVLPLLRAGCSP
ncbi:LLM class flavin-dependent oxidoreductase [Phytohabitans flavus]|uniref:LLM class flavin-dependent oxidoreductase n=1 Tax=Phytohabitans flavus TaxID=1076124 RepID=UPI00362DF4BC